MKDREERMEREDSFHSCADSIASSSSDLSSIPSLSNASLGRPLCEYEEFCSPSWRSWASDESGPLSRTSSHSPLDAHDALLKELHELLEVKEKLLDVWIIVNNKYLTDEAWSWLRRVHNMVVIVNKSRQRRKSSLLFPWRRNIDVLKLRISITALSREGENFIHAFSNTFSNMFNNVIDHEGTLSQRSTFVGHEDTLSQLGALLGSEESNIICITGPSGIGKTRILQEFLMLNEKTISRIRFDVVFLTTLPHEKPISALQDAIAERINLSLPDYNREEHRRMVLYNALSDMKFLLVLDDLRSVLDLEAIGIPLPTRESMSKIVVTSRSAEVCTRMRVDMGIPVLPLSDEQSWELFRNLIRYEATADAEMKEWGKGLVRKFSGLPSAIISMAWGIDESMENISMEDSGGSIEEWISQFKYSELLSEYWQDHVKFREQRWLWIGHTQALTSPIKGRLRTEFCSPSWRSDAT